jgi:hypothetical protein
MLRQAQHDGERERGRSGDIMSIVMEINIL